MKAALVVTACTCLSLFAATSTSLIGQTGHITVTSPKKDGNEHITVGFKLPGETSSRSLSATAFGINGKPRNSADDPQTTPEEKASALSKALQAAIKDMDATRAAQDPSLGPTGLSVSANLDSIDVSLPGGRITAFHKTDNTNEPKDTATVSPEEGELAMGSVTLNGAISGAAAEQNGTAQLWVQVGWQEYLIPTTQGMTLRELLAETQRVLELDGNRVTTLGATGLTVILPFNAPTFGVGSDDRTLGIERFGAAVL